LMRDWNFLDCTTRLFCTCIVNLLSSYLCAMMRTLLSIRCLFFSPSHSFRF
jgi:hypothetical protein